LNEGTRLTADGTHRQSMDVYRFTLYHILHVKTPVLPAPQ